MADKVKPTPQPERQIAVLRNSSKVNRAFAEVRFANDSKAKPQEQKDLTLPNIAHDSPQSIDIELSQFGSATRIDEKKDFEAFKITLAEDSELPTLMKSGKKVEYKLLAKHELFIAQKKYLVLSADTDGDKKADIRFFKPVRPDYKP